MGLFARAKKQRSTQMKISEEHRIKIEMMMMMNDCTSATRGQSWTFSLRWCDKLYNFLISRLMPIWRFHFIDYELNSVQNPALFRWKISVYFFGEYQFSLETIQLTHCRVEAKYKIPLRGLWLHQTVLCERRILQLLLGWFAMERNVDTWQRIASRIWDK